MSTRMMAVVTMMWACALLTSPTPGRAQPAMNAPGCCCVKEGAAFGCSVQSQADCLARQPKAPTFPKGADWKVAWEKYLAADEAAESEKLSGGWIAEPCTDVLNPKTGEPRGAATGCCCFPPADGRVCKADMTDFDCKAECAGLRDGSKPSGCTWAKGACSK